MILNGTNSNNDKHCYLLIDSSILCAFLDNNINLQNMWPADENFKFAVKMEKDFAFLLRDSAKHAVQMWT